MMSFSMLLGSFVLFCLRFVQHKDKFLLTTLLSPKPKNKNEKKKQTYSPVSRYRC